MSFTPQHGLVAPAPEVVAERPLPAGAVTLLPGFWADRQRINRERSIPHGMEKLRAAGGFDNFRHIADRAAGAHGHLSAVDGDVKNFVDSDVYKWLEAVGWEGVRGPLAAEVEQQAEEAIGLIVRAQDASGYLNTWYQTQPVASRFSNMAFGHELYCLGHLIQAGLAYVRARGDGRLLGVARRFADLAVATFGPNGREEICGHPEIEMALVELSRELGEPGYADLAQRFIDRRGHGLLRGSRFGTAYHQDDRPYREMDTVNGHAVRALYLGCGAVDVATQHGDAALLAAARRQWRAMIAGKMYLTGGVGSRHLGESFGEPFELPADRAYCETCAAIAVAMWGWRLLLVERDGAVADVIERAMLNGMLAGVSHDGCSFHYTNPLHVRSQHPRQPWFEIACCPPNLMRTLASIEQYMATASARGVSIHHYAAAEIRAGQGRALRLETGYPFEGGVRVIVTETPAAPWRLALRIPAWAGDAALSVNGQRQDIAAEKGYVEVDRTWQAGDELMLELSLRPRLTQASTIDAVRGAIAVERGPLVFCAEEVDLPAGANLMDTYVDHRAAPRDAASGPTLFGRSVILSAVAIERARPSWPYGASDDVPRLPESRAIEIQTIPYFAWGNRGPGPMRVWMPKRQP